VGLKAGCPRGQSLQEVSFAYNVSFQGKWICSPNPTRQQLVASHDQKSRDREAVTRTICEKPGCQGGKTGSPSADQPLLAAAS
jgi:hypothetical protein